MENQIKLNKVLVVDDEAYFRRFIGEILRKEGFVDISEATNGRDALEKFSAKPTDFVILDINMPHMDGVDALKALRKMAPDLPVIMLTSIADEMVVEKCVEEGAAYFIRKDVPANELVPELRRVLVEFIAEQGLTP